MMKEVFIQFISILIVINQINNVSAYSLWPTTDESTRSNENSVTNDRLGSSFLNLADFLGPRSAIVSPDAMPCSKQLRVSKSSVIFPSNENNKNRGPCDKDLATLCPYQSQSHFNDLNTDMYLSRLCLWSKKEELSNACVDFLTIERPSFIEPCSQSIASLCEDIEPGNGRIHACLNANRDDISVRCAKALDAETFQADPTKPSLIPNGDDDDQTSNDVMAQIMSMFRVMDMPTVQYASSQYSSFAFFMPARAAPVASSMKDDKSNLRRRQESPPIESLPSDPIDIFPPIYSVPSPGPGDGHEGVKGLEDPNSPVHVFHPVRPDPDPNSTGAISALLSAGKEYINQNLRLLYQTLG